MKKLICILLVLVTALSLCACGKDTPTATHKKPTENSSDPETQETQSTPQTQQIDLNNYVIFDEVGYDLGGSAKNIRLDIDRLKADYADRFANIKMQEMITGTPEGPESLDYFIYDYIAEGFYDGYVVMSVDTSDPNEVIPMMLEKLLPRPLFQDTIHDTVSDLSNGDKVPFYWADKTEENLDALSRILGLPVICSDGGTRTVNNLAPLKEIDPFSYVYLYFSGQNGNATLEYKEGIVYLPTPDGDYEKVTVDVVIPANNGSLRNGDTVHVSFKSPMDDKLIAKTMGIKLTRQEADYEIHGLNAYGQPGASNGQHATVNLSDYIYTATSGNYEERTEYTFRLDYERLMRDHRLSVSENVAQEDLLDYNLPYGAAQKILQSYSPITFTSTSHTSNSTYSDLTISGGLKNGDTVTIVPQIDQEKLAKLQKVMNVTFVTDPIEYTVNGMKALIPIDPFQNCTITFTGSNGSGTAAGTVDLENDHVLVSCTFEVISGNNGALSNGDKVVFRIKEAELQLINTWTGLVPTVTEYEVTVSGLT